MTLGASVSSTSRRRTEEPTSPTPHGRRSFRYQLGLPYRHRPLPIPSSTPMTPTELLHRRWTMTCFDRTQHDDRLYSCSRAPVPTRDAPRSFAPPPHLTSPWAAGILQDRQRGYYCRSTIPEPPVTNARPPTPRCPTAWSPSTATSPAQTRCRRTAMPAAAIRSGWATGRDRPRPHHHRTTRPVRTDRWSGLRPRHAPARLALNRTRSGPGARSPTAAAARYRSRIKLSRRRWQRRARRRLRLPHGRPLVAARGGNVCYDGHGLLRARQREPPP